MIWLAIKRKGNYVTIPEKKMYELKGAFGNPHLKSSTAVANHLGISKTTVRRYLNLLASKGEISEAHPLLKLKHGGINPGVQMKKDARMRAMVTFGIKESRKGVPLSVNLLQTEHGGTKADAKKALGIIQERMHRTFTPMLRRTQSDQTTRPRN